MRLKNYFTMKNTSQIQLTQGTQPGCVGWTGDRAQFWGQRNHRFKSLPPFEPQFPYLTSKNKIKKEKQKIVKPNP